jgi:hypothetical protein
MRTPAGTECSFFYEDFFRGRATQQCRLPGVGDAWRAALCAACPVPGIQLANGCRHMSLRGLVESRWFGLRKQVRVTAYCRRSNHAVDNPYTGCELCHADVLHSLVLPPEEETS